MNDLEGRAALVTGGGTGIGRASALLLGARGARVAVHYNKSREGALAVVKELREKGCEAEAFGGDLTQSAAARASWSATRSAWRGRGTCCCSRGASGTARRSSTRRRS